MKGRLSKMVLPFLTLGLITGFADGARAYPVLTITFDFGDVNVGGSSSTLADGLPATYTFTIDPSEVCGNNVTSTLSGDLDQFQVDDTCNGFLPGGSSCQWDVTFKPTKPGPFSLTLTFTTFANVSQPTGSGYTCFPDPYGPLTALFVYTGRGVGPQQATVDLMAQVNSLVSAGTLSGGPGTALNATLNAALGQINSGNKTAATNQLGAFINQVNALVQSGRLSAGQGQALVISAQAIINQLTH